LLAFLGMTVLSKLITDVIADSDRFGGVFMQKMPLVLSKLHEIATILAPQMEGQIVQKVFQRVLNIIFDLFEVDHTTITLLDEGRRFFVVKAEYPQLSKQIVGEPIPIQDRTGSVNFFV
jgi:hypothetical protein